MRRLLAHQIRRRKAVGFGTLERTRVFWGEPNRPSYSMVHGQRFAAESWIELYFRCLAMSSRTAGTRSLGTSMTV
jgi:hypothetical protein